MAVTLAFHGAAGTVTGSHYVLETPQGGRSSDPHSAMVDCCNASMAVRILGASDPALREAMVRFQASLEAMVAEKDAAVQAKFAGQ